MHEPVPPWLRGTWARRSILRRSPTGTLDVCAADAGVVVRYIQTPWAFVDVRRPAPRRGPEGILAFAGVTTVADQVVRWHSILNFDTMLPDPAGAWNDATAGCPRATEDAGWFTPQQEPCWLERALDGSLEEVWQKVDDGGGRFLCLQRGPTGIVVVVGEHFGAVIDDRATGGSTCCYVAGRVTAAGWMIDLSATDDAEEGQPLQLPGTPEDWTPTPDSTLSWPPVDWPSPMSG
ncbi:MAG: hypothetical protein ACI8S6_003664 [Myxococcota bacterium]|jgi:hypothetical protein